MPLDQTETDDPYEGAAQQYGVDANLLRALTTVESSNNDQAVSPQGAVGRAQILPSTASGLGVTDPTNPKQAVYGAAKYLRQNFDQFGRPDLAIAAYHGGPDTSQWGPKTRDYVDKIVDRYSTLKGGGGGGAQPVADDSYVDDGQWDQPEEKKTLSIGQVRQQYPQYKDLSDEQLAQGLHKKYYADMPFDQFSAKIGLQPAKSGQTAPAQPEQEQEPIPNPRSLPMAKRDEGNWRSFQAPPLAVASMDPEGTNLTGADNPVSRIGQAAISGAKEGFGGSPVTTILSDKAQAKLDEIQQAGGWKGTVAQLASTLGTDIGTAGKFIAGLGGAAQGAYQRGMEQAGEEAGAPQLGRDLAALPDVFPQEAMGMRGTLDRAPHEAVAPGAKPPVEGAVTPARTDTSPAEPVATNPVTAVPPAATSEIPTMTVRPSRTPMLERMSADAKAELAMPAAQQTPAGEVPAPPAALDEKPAIEAPASGERPAPIASEPPPAVEGVTPDGEVPPTPITPPTETDRVGGGNPASPARLRTLQQIQDEDGVGAKRAAAIQMEEIAAMGRPITDEERQARAAGVQLQPPPTPPVPTPPRTGAFEPVPKEPQRLVNFLRQSWQDNLGNTQPGGIRDPGGDVSAIIGGNKGRPGLISSRGDNLDNATMRAWQAGYLPEFNDRPMINDLLDKIDHDHNMQPVYSMHDADAAEAYSGAMARNDEIDRLAQEHGIETKGVTRQQFFDNLADKMSVDDATREMQSQSDAHDAAYREAERAARAWSAEQTGEVLNLKDIYGQSQARSLEDLENEHREIEAAEATPASEQRAPDDREPGPPAADQGPVPEGAEPRGDSAGAGRGIDPATGRPVGSWVITDKETGKAVAETFEPRDLARLNTDKYQAVPAGEYLGNLNKNPAAETPAQDLLGRPIDDKPAARAAEPTIRNDPNQATMPGMEASAHQAQAARDAQGPRTDQLPPNEGLFQRPEIPQPGLKLYAGPTAIFDPDAWRWMLGPLKAPMQKLAGALGQVSHSIAMGLVPMREGTVRAQAFASDFANSLRQVKYHFDTIDKEIERNFKPAEREQMARAMDAQSVFEQQFRDMNPVDQAAARQAFEDGKTGVAGLNPAQRQVVEMLDTISQATWKQMQDRGMVDPKAQGLPYYFPRQILNWTEEEGFTHAGGAGGSGSGLDTRGKNLTTSGPMERKHLTPEETEAAAKAKLGQQATLLRDIRSLPSRLAYAQRAITGVDLMNQIDRVGKDTGVNLVVKGDIPGLLKPGDYFTNADHPSFRQFTGTGWKAIHVAKEFEGPLRAVLTQAAPTWYKAAAQLKGGVMSAIMYSPFIHLAVELGRALPVMMMSDPVGTLTLKALRDGSTMRKDLDFMDQATKDGLAPLGSRWASDPVSIADQQNVDGRNRFVAAMAGMRDAVANAAGKTPKVGQFLHDAIQHPHQALLWDQVFNLQVGLYNQLRQNWIAKGYAPDVAGTMAAHIANRYAGALPSEALSRGANIASNLLLFSRSFTLGNLGVMKDMFNGAPTNVRSRITQMAGADVAKSAQASMRRKAISAVVMDVGLFYMGNALLQTGIQAMQQGVDKTEQDLMAHAQSAMHEVSQGNLLGAFNVLPQHWNEPGKQDRVYAGTDSSGRGVYLRLPPGKVGEEFLGWAAKPGPQLLAKLSPLVRPIVEAALGYDTLGRPIYQPNPQGVTDNAKIAGQVVKHIVESLGPTSTIEGLHEMWQQHVQGAKTKDDPGVSALKILGPLSGLAQVSSGYPGGPAAGEVHAESERERFEQQKAMPDIRQKILNGDREGAMKDMADVGIPPGLRSYYLRQTLNPGITPKQNQNFQRNAPADIKQRVEMQRGQQQ